MLFATALRRCKNKNFVFFGIGSSLRKDEDEKEIEAQQFPSYAKEFARDFPHMQVEIILICPSWKDYPPLDVEGHYENKSTFVPFDFPNVRVRIITDFLNSEDEHLLYDFIKNEKRLNQKIIIGDFTITSPFSPLEIFPLLRSLAADNSVNNVFVATSSKSSLIDTIQNSHG